MEIISDLHIHGPHSQGTSNNTTFELLEKHAKLKGLQLLGTGDFSHPIWWQEIKKMREEKGILYSKTNFPFMITGEISLIYTEEAKGRKVHLILLIPSIAIGEKVIEMLKTIGRIDYDGRPIFGMSCRDMAKKLKNISDKIEIIPAHIWTPYFGILGEHSHYSSIQQAFDDLSLVHSIETGMSSDPEMNYRLSSLDNFAILSFSDSHSYKSERIGREATVFNVKELTYDEILRAIRENDIASTIETDPCYGKYHYDGHADCKVFLSPNESLELGNICPKCGKKLTIGVEHRVEELADRKPGFIRKNAKPYLKLMPLKELISLIYGKGIETKEIKEVYEKSLSLFESELFILKDADENKLRSVFVDEVVDAILLMRKGKLTFRPGYDGLYGEPVVKKLEKKEKVKKTLKEFN